MILNIKHFTEYDPLLDHFYNKDIDDLYGLISFFGPKNLVPFSIYVYPIDVFPNITGRMEIDLDSSKLIIEPIKVNNKTYIKKLNHLKKLYKIFLYTNKSYPHTLIDEAIIDFSVNLDKNFGLNENTLQLKLKIYFSNDVFVDIEDYMHNLLTQYCSEDFILNTDTDDLIDLISMIEA